MENIINNPGLQHLVERIFLNLNYEDLQKCQLINQSTKHILENSMFWVKKLVQRGLSKDNQKVLIKAIQSVKNSDKEKHILSFLKWNLKTEERFGFPLVGTPIYWAACRGFTEVVKILAPLTDNPNAPIENGTTAIYWATSDGHTEIVKILAPLTDNPNAPEKNGVTPLHLAASNGHTEIVKILAPLTNNHNTPDINGMTPIK